MAICSLGIFKSFARISLCTSRNFRNTTLLAASRRKMASESDLSNFVAEKVVPDVLAAVPPALLKVIYNNNIEVVPGQVLTPTQVQNPPKILFDGTQAGTYYSLYMHDPDAPSRKDPRFGEWHHWLVVNIPGGDGTLDVSKGVTKSDYVGSGPPQGTGLHRYVFALCSEGSSPQPYKGLQKIGMTGTGRNNLKLSKFLKDYKLNVVAGNFYQAEWDDYVPKLYAKLK